MSRSKPGIGTSVAFALIVLGSTVSSVAAQGSARTDPGSLRPLTREASTLEQVEDSALDLGRLEALALANNPTLIQAASGVDAATGHRDQAGRHPNPHLVVAGEELSFGRFGDGSQYALVIEQPLLIGGKRRSRTALAARAEDQARIEAGAQRQRVLTHVRQLFYRVLAAVELVGLRTQLVEVADEAVEITNQLVNVGAAALPDSLEARIVARRAGLDLSRARIDLVAARRQLAAVVSVPSVVAVRLVGSLSEVPDLNHDAVLADLYDRSPELDFSRAELSRAEALILNARAEGKSDLSLMAGVGWNADRFEVDLARRGWQGTLGVKLELPVFDRNQGEIVAALAFKEVAIAALRRIELSIGSRLARVYAEYAGARDVVQIYEDEIVPAAEEAHALYRASYERMAASYPQVLLAERSVLEARAARIQGLDEMWRAAVTMQGLLLTDGLSQPGTIVEPSMSTPAGVGHEQ